MNTKKRLSKLLDELRLKEIKEFLKELVDLAEKESLSHEEFLLELLEKEVEGRNQRKKEKFLQESKLPHGKTMQSFDIKRLDLHLVGIVKRLLSGEFIERKENVLAFGNPGTGKTHILAGICRELVEKGHRVLFITCQKLVQDLLRKKQELLLSEALKKLDRYAIILIDDIGYVQQNRAEMEVLFSFLAYRYERGSVMVTSNLPFSQWEKIFKDPMTTAAAIDRLIHHCVILEMNLLSYRLEESQRNKKKLLQTEDSDQEEPTEKKKEEDSPDDKESGNLKEKT